MMPKQPVILPPACNYQALSDSARNLARTLQAAPAQESHRAAALRQYLQTIAAALAEQCDGMENGADRERYETCWSLVFQIRTITAALSAAPPVAPHGIGVVVQAFAERLLPDALVTLNPSRMGDYSAAEYLQRLHTLLEELQLDRLEKPAETPERFLVLRYPQGEQDNALMACMFMRAFGPERKEGDAFATWALGPAYFFALASDIEMSLWRNAAYTHLRLCHVSDLLKSAGWFDHPQIGPLLAACRERFGFHANYVREHLRDPEKAPAASLESWPDRVPGLRGYTPEDFDRDVPRLWERLRQLVPPNDLDINAVESEQPADEVSILNAGWSFYLLHMDDLYRILGSKTAEDRYEAKQVLNRLLTKGIELSQIARRWKEAREEA